MSLVGMRSAIGQAIGEAANRRQVDALISVLNMAEDDFASGFMGRLGSQTASQTVRGADCQVQSACSTAEAL